MQPDGRSQVEDHRASDEVEGLGLHGQWQPCTGWPGNANLYRKYAGVADIYIYVYIHMYIIVYK